jgi:hypothetical protein
MKFCQPSLPGNVGSFVQAGFKKLNEFLPLRVAKGIKTPPTQTCVLRIDEVFSSRASQEVILPKDDMPEFLGN